MKSDGYLVPPAPGEKDAIIWHDTWRRVDRFLPAMRKEIFPDPPPQRQQQQQQRQSPRQEKVSAEQGRQGDTLADAKVPEL